MKSIVRLPADVGERFEVYVNGVPQQRGVDFVVRGRDLVFARDLHRAERLSTWRWFLGAWGIGTYRQDDSVDVRYEAGGRPRLAERLDISRQG